VTNDSRVDEESETCIKDLPIVTEVTRIDCIQELSGQHTRLDMSYSQNSIFITEIEIFRQLGNFC